MALILICRCTATFRRAGVVHHEGDRIALPEPDAHELAARGLIELGAPDPRQVYVTSASTGEPLPGGSIRGLPGTTTIPRGDS